MYKNKLVEAADNGRKRQKERTERTKARVEGRTKRAEIRANDKRSITEKIFGRGKEKKRERELISKGIWSPKMGSPRESLSPKMGTSLGSPIEKPMLPKRITEPKYEEPSVRDYDAPIPEKYESRKSKIKMKSVKYKEPGIITALRQAYPNWDSMPESEKDRLVLKHGHAGLSKTKYK